MSYEQKLLTAEEERQNKEECFERLRIFREMPLWKENFKPYLEWWAEYWDTLSDETDDPVKCFAYRKAFSAVKEIILWLNRDTP